MAVTESAQPIVGAVHTQLGEDVPPVGQLRFFQKTHDGTLSGAGSRLNCRRLSWGEFGRVEILSGNEAELRHGSDHRGICRHGRRIGLHEIAEQPNVGCAVHSIDLVTHRVLRVPGWIHDAGWRAIRLPPSAEWCEFVLRLNSVDRCIVGRLAGRVGTAKYPDNAGRRFVFGLDAGRQRALPTWAGDSEIGGPCSGGPLAGVGEHVGPAG